MVLEAGLIRKSLFAVMLSTSSGCAANESKITDHATIEGHSLTLRMSQDSCLLDSKISSTVKTTVLDVKPPCYFLRQENQNLQSFSYKDVGVLSTIIVVGSQISDEKRKKWAIKEGLVCGESRQGILFKNSGFIVSKKILEGGVVCKDKGADEKDFWYFAH